MQIMKTRMISMRAMALALVAAVGFSAAGVRAADPIDPRLYLPEVKKDESMFVAIVKTPELLKLDAVKAFRKEHEIDKEIAKHIINVTLDDVVELVMVGVGTSEGASKTVGLVRFNKDLEVKDV